MTTKKNKEQFEKWFIENEISNRCGFRRFCLYPLSMQWGVYLEYYDSLGMALCIKYRELRDKNRSDYNKSIAYWNKFYVYTAISMADL